MLKLHVCVNFSSRFKICKVVSDRIGIELGGVFMGRADATLSIFWSERIMGTDVEPSFDVYVSYRHERHYAFRLLVFVGAGHTERTYMAIHEMDDMSEGPTSEPRTRVLM